ncbi:MAG: hypothetical protein IIX61_05545 [Loktanella sp.]|nr:hypothetical protein [Loktanella sp.]
MRQELVDAGGLDYAPCRYGSSRIWFRGPRKVLDQPYVTFIGSTATYGKFIASPFSDLVEQATGQTCINLGCVNGGIDTFVNDPQIIDICRTAETSVVQIMGANNLSNRFYSVHPRRNDRFLRALTILHAIYAEVDFTTFSFTRHLLGHLHHMSAERFEYVVHELRQAWVARMQSLLGQIGPHAVLLWFSADPLNDDTWSDNPVHLQTDPLFVTAGMVDRLRPLARSVVVVNPSDSAMAQGTAGMSIPLTQQEVALRMLSFQAHEEAATALIPALATR